MERDSAPEVNAVSTFVATLLVVVAVLVVGLVVLSMSLVAAAFFGRRKLRAVLERAAMPSPDVVETEFQSIRRLRPNADTRALVSAIAHKSAVKAGAVGALADLGGALVEFVALPADAYFTVKAQATGVYLVARAHGIHLERYGYEERLKIALALCGADRLAAYGLKLAFKSAVTAVPVVGAAVSFVFNYAVVQATCRLADQYFAKQLATAGEPASVAIPSAPYARPWASEALPTTATYRW